MRIRVAYLFVAFSISCWAYPTGSRIPAGNAGEPTSGTPCTPCHSVSLNPTGGSVALSVPEGLTYKAGEAQTWVLKITDSSSGSRRYGFQLTATKGTLAGGASSGTSNGQQYISQNSSATSYTITWTPPADATGTLKVYVAGVSCSGTRDTKVWTASYSLEPAAAATPVTPSVPTPTLKETQAVLNLATGEATVAEGVLFSVEGSNLTQDGVSAHWSDSRDEAGLPPTALAGVQVRVLDTPARLVSVAPDKIVAIAPALDTRGAVQVRVLAPHGESGTAEITVADSARALYKRGDIALAHLEDGALLAKPAEFDAVWLARPAHANGVVVLTASGFNGIDDLARIAVRVGENSTATVEGLEAGLPGLWKLRIRLPADLAEGDYEVEGSVDGVAVAGKRIVPVRK